MDSKNPQHSKNYKWSDKRCLKIASEETFPSIVKDLKVQKNIISRYLNFYLGGRIVKGLSARDMAFAAIAIMPISPHSEEFIWTESEYSEDGYLFFLTPDDKLKYDIKTVITKRSIDKDNVENTLNNEQLSEHETDLDTDCDISVQPEIETDLNTDCDTSVDPENESNINSDEENSEKLIKDDIDHENDPSNNLTSDKPETFVGILQWYRLKRDEQTNQPTEEKKYDPVENAAFCIYFNRLLDTWETSVQSRIILKCFFALVALFAMRGKVKTFQNLTKYFSTKFHSVFNSVCSFTSDAVKCYTPPHKSFLKRSWKTFRESNHKNEIMFAKLVKISLTKQDRMNNYGKYNIIKFTVLSHTVYFGMGVIGMLQQIATFNNCDFKFFFKALYTDETATSWNRVNDFFKKYMAQQARQYTFHWASVIEGDSFRDLSCTNNYEFAVVLAVFIEKLTGNTGIWHSAWVSKGNDLEKWKQFGYKLYEDHNKNLLEDLIMDLGLILDL